MVSRETEYPNLVEARRAYLNGEISAEEFAKYLRKYSLGSDEYTRDQPKGMTDTIVWY
jgi:hypothetical protein